MLLLWLAILVGAVFLSRMIGAEVAQNRTLRSDPFHVCDRPINAQQAADCERAAQMVREALQRRD